MPQALSGTRRSVPKICRINGDDNMKLIYKNLGNNHAVPFVWGDAFTMASGTQEIVIASGIKFHGKTLASYGNVTASPMSDVGSRWWIEKDATDNRVLIKSSAAVGDDVDFDCKFMMGDDPDMESLYCRGNRGAMPSYP
jgi:hypothetical protein